MKTLILELFSNFWILLSSISVYLLMGVLVAGVFKLLLPDALVKQHLGSHSFIANIKAAVLGIPLPLCSCSVIPFISVLKKSGASKSAIQTFLISTPITGADSIMASYGVFGWAFTVYRVITSVVISLFAGLITLFLDRESDSRAAIDVNKNKAEKTFAAYRTRDVQGHSFKPVSQSSCNVNDMAKIKSGANAALLNIGVVKAEEKPNRLQQVLAFAFDDVLKDISRSLLVGIIIGAVIVTFIPENLAAYISANVFLNYLLVLLVSVPLYVCATSSIPLGLSLLSAGFSPGAAFIFLTAGPATNTVTISVVQKTLGNRSLMIYLLSVILGSLFFGTLFDYLFPHSLEKMFSFLNHEESPGFIAQISAVILLYLTLKYTFNKNTRIIKKGGCSGGNGGCCGTG